MDEPAGLRLLVHPELQSGIAIEDREYFDSLLKDFVERAQTQPAALFRQLCSLAVGPLIVSLTGPALVEHPHLLSHCARFVPAAAVHFDPRTI